MTGPGNGRATLLAAVSASILSSIPLLTSVLFFAAAVKVFRAANMETATTVAVVSSADVVALLKGVILTLLPGFLAALTAAVIWWWSADLPASTVERADRMSAQQWRNVKSAFSLGNPRFCVVLGALVVAFFTLPWTVFLIFAMVVVGAWLVLRQQSLGRWTQIRTVRTGLRAGGLLLALTMIGTLALSSTVWLPIRLVELRPGFSVSLRSQVVRGQIAAYVLDSAPGQRTSLLLDKPRAVIDIPTDQFLPYPQLCITPPSPHRWLFLRASQRIGLDKDFGSPYALCP